MKRITPLKSYSVSVDLFLILQHYLKETGVDPDPTGSLAADMLRQSAADGRIPVERFATYWEQAVKASADTNFGLHFGQAAAQIGRSGILQPVMANCPDVHDALEKLVRYHNLVTDFIQLHLEEKGDWVMLVWHTASPQIPIGRHLTESIFCNLVYMLRGFSRREVHPAALHFCHAEPHDLSEHIKIFNCPLVFNAGQNELHFLRNDLAQPIFLANPALLQRMEQIAREMQAAREDSSWHGKVYTNIQEGLSRGEKPALSGVAAALALSPRQIQANLAEEGISYQEILDEVRQAMALQYLKDDRLSICEIAFLLGFNEQSAFTHAFKRWKGVSPAAFRQRS